MFKRPAHILFLSAPPGRLAKMAYDVAFRLGDQWLESRAGCVDAAGSTSLCNEGMASPNDADMVAWADLVVTLDASSQRHCPPLPPDVRCKHWALDAAQPAGKRRGDLGADIESRVASMIGGLRMLARSDSVDATAFDATGHDGRGTGGD